MVDTPATRAIRDLGLSHRVVRHRRVGSLEEAAAIRGVHPSAIVKTMVVRRADGDYIFVLVPGNRVISWPKLRAHLGVSRLSLADADTARDVTGYERGTITPLGASTAWPVVADAMVGPGDISIGGGAHGVSITVDASSLLMALEAVVADVTDPA